MDNGSLQHHGVTGMKWGIRRYQRKDGTLTPAGKKRYEKELEKLKAEEKVVKTRERVKAKFAKLDAKKAELDKRKEDLDGKKQVVKKQNANEKSSVKSVKDMTDDELMAAVNRSRLEAEYKKLNPPTVSKGKKFVNKLMRDVVAPAATTAARTALTKYLGQASEKVLNKAASKQAETVKKSMDKAKEKQEKKQAKAEAKAAKAEAKAAKATVSGTGTSKADKGRAWTNDTIIDVEWRDVTPSSSTGTKYAQLGEQYVAGLLPEKIDR